MRYAPTFFLLLHCGCGESVNNSCVMIVPISVNYFRISYGECPFAVISALKFRKRGEMSWLHSMESFCNFALAKARMRVLCVVQHVVAVT